MPTRYIQRRSSLAPGDVSLANANVVFVDSDDDQLKFTTGASGTTTVDVVTESQTQTLTNKTLTSPTINAPVGTAATEVVSATNVLTTAESGTTFFLNSGTEFASTLPAPSAGVNYTFIVTAAPSGASYTVATEGGCQVLGGHVLTSGFADSGSDVETTPAGTTITFVDGVSVVGDKAYVISDGTNWFASCITAVEAGITITG